MNRTQIRNKTENPRILPRSVVNPIFSNKLTLLFFWLEVDFAEDNPGAAAPHSIKGTIDDAHSHNTILSSQNVKELEKNESICRARIKMASADGTENAFRLRPRETPTS